MSLFKRKITERQDNFIIDFSHHRLLLSSRDGGGCRFIINKTKQNKTQKDKNRIIKIAKQALETWLDAYNRLQETVDYTQQKLNDYTEKTQNLNSGTN